LLNLPLLTFDFFLIGITNIRVFIRVEREGRIKKENTNTKKRKKKEALL